MKPFSIYVLVLCLLFIGGIIGVAMTGNVLWLALSVIPGVIFWRSMRI
jgi:hypothetical protein